MTERDETKPKILCVGRDAILLEYRCAVLQHEGYEATFALFPQAYQLLRTGSFSLVIISAAQAAEQNGALTSNLPVQTKTLILPSPTFPTEMLDAVRAAISEQSARRNPGDYLVATRGASGS